MMNLGDAIRKVKAHDKEWKKREIKFQRHSYYYFFKRVDLEIRRLKYKDLLCNE
jgi:hypothetical protein